MSLFWPWASNLELNTSGNMLCSNVDLMGLLRSRPLQLKNQCWKANVNRHWRKYFFNHWHYLTQTRSIFQPFPLKFCSGRCFDLTTEVGLIIKLMRQLRATFVLHVSLQGKHNINFILNPAGLARHLVRSIEVHASFRISRILYKRSTRWERKNSVCSILCLYSDWLFTGWNIYRREIKERIAISYMGLTF